MEPPSYMRSIVDRNVVMRRMTVHLQNLYTDTAQSFRLAT
jgi:hypothetical protein